MDEQQRLDAGAGWYRDDQLTIDRRLVDFRFRALADWLRPGSCLELGPADGVMTARLVEVCESVTVVDAAGELLDMIPDRPNLTKVRSLFEGYEPAAPVDNVVMEHILEHVAEPVALLKRARDWLAPGARLLAGVPNGHSIHRLAAVKMGLLGDPCELNERDHAVGHRRVYTPDTLRADVAAAGLRVIHEGGVFLKPLANSQIEATWSEEMIEGFFQLGRDLPHLAAEILFVCEPEE